ncbi:MAG: hypothetical protein C3F18_03530 [Nitrosomonadales bacterium]|nr:MAG: hypothetical protein C3F18_03530 [Nitrosomonadales bacterium]
MQAHLLSLLSLILAAPIIKGVADMCMRRRCPAFYLQDLFSDPDFWVFVVSLVVSPIVIFNLLA